MISARKSKGAVSDKMRDLSSLPDRALSIRQPWVWAILHAGKRIENRPRRFHYRGPICLHASLYHKQIEYGIAQADIWDAGGIDAPHDWDVARGGIVGTAEIVGCVDRSDSPWFFGPFGLVLDNVQPVPFVPVKGMLGLFNWRSRVVEGGGDNG